jgi:iron complex transport system substrate-binding protein
VGLPVLTSTKVRPRASSRDVDRDVRAVLRDALAVYDVDVEALERAAPDVIVTQDLCDVCAVSLDDVRAAVKKIAKSDARIVNLHPLKLADVWSDMMVVGGALGRLREADAAVQALLARVERVRERASVARVRPNVLTIEWIDPVMIGGTWMPELVEIAGGRALVTRPGDHAPTLELDALRTLGPAPDVVVVKPCGFDLARTLSEIDVLRALFDALDWPAIREQRVWLADGNAYFNRPGPRIADSLEILAACVHPELFADMAERYRASFVRLDEVR